MKKLFTYEGFILHNCSSKLGIQNGECAISCKLLLILQISFSKKTMFFKNILNFERTHYRRKMQTLRANVDYSRYDCIFGLKLLKQFEVLTC